MENIRNILETEKNVAVVGISDKEDRDSFKVAKYLHEHGFNVIPVNPVLKQWLGIKAYANLKDAASEHHIDIVDIFRKSEAVPEIVHESIAIKPKTIWMQLGVMNDEAADNARKHGIKVIMDRCIMVEHRKL
ncbi:MAG: CoA-binding protein [Candidatus Thermoplasmatota archaeon]|nr:CoA-binding protein [Candidatus Thermoplasmatota archaeon]MCL5987408.1 CoA-binding protein [Candidatus Thermoplasmatota archaeon]